MAREFEVFTGRFKPASSKTMRVTLNTRGVFSLNSATYTALGEPRFVELLYDKTNRVIGLRPTEETTKHAYPVRRSEEHTSELQSQFHLVCRLLLEKKKKKQKTNKEKKKKKNKNIKQHKKDKQ